MNVRVIDDLHPEDGAMLQALYSRDPGPVEAHLAKVRQGGSGKFMDRFYVGYGHKSIGDCGSTTVFIEGVSMLAAKAIQDWPLYRGQESSTRYVDWSKQPIDDPIGTEASASTQRRWMDFYHASQVPLLKHLRCRYPIRDGEDAAVYERALKARACDVLRAFLPAGATTNVSWHTDLRQAADHLDLLRHHPDRRIYEMASQIEAALAARYPHSFSAKRDDRVEAYRLATVSCFNYFDPEVPSKEGGTYWSSDPGENGNVTLRCGVSNADLVPYRGVVVHRPPRVELPRFLAELGLLRFEFLLDFGSFRDLQRHRNGVCRMPLLTTCNGFHPWYLGEMSDAMRQEAERLIAQQAEEIRALTHDVVTRQYYVAMGFRVPCRVTYGLPASVYVVELRTGKTVHPTMRRVAQGMAKALRAALPEVTLHVDLDPDDWDVRRGKQTIVERET